jgi:hypothetical protein
VLIKLGVEALDRSVDQAAVTAKGQVGKARYGLQNLERRGTELILQHTCTVLSGISLASPTAIYIQWGVLQRAMLQRTNATTNTFYQ